MAGKSAQAYLYGSRINDRAKGGDIDLLIELQGKISRIEQAKLKIELEKALELPVDILVHEKSSQLTPFQEIAYTDAIKLEPNQ